jgi:hypothetical protein
MRLTSFEAPYPDAGPVPGAFLLSSFLFFLLGSRPTPLLLRGSWLSARYLSGR